MTDDTLAATVAHAMNDQGDDRQDRMSAHRSEMAGMDYGLRVLSYLIAGVLVYGGLGWVGDHYLGTSFLLPIGIMLGAAGRVLRDHPTLWSGTQRGLCASQILPGRAQSSCQARHLTCAGHDDHTEGGSSVSGQLLSLIPLEGFEAPGPQSFTHAGEPIFPGVPGLEWLTKFMLQAIVSVVLIVVFWIVMSRKNASWSRARASSRASCAVHLRPQRHRAGHRSATTGTSTCPPARPVLLRPGQQPVRYLPADVDADRRARQLVPTDSPAWCG